MAGTRLASVDEKPALAMGVETRDRCRGKSSGHGTDDTANHQRRQVRLSCGHGTGRGWRLIPSRRLRAGRSIDVGVRAWLTAPTTQRAIVVGSASIVTV